MESKQQVQRVYEKFIGKHLSIEYSSHLHFPYKFKKYCINSFLPEYLFQHMQSQCTLEAEY